MYLECKKEKSSLLKVWFSALIHDWKIKYAPSKESDRKKYEPKQRNWNHLKFYYKGISRDKQSLLGIFL